MATIQQHLAKSLERLSEIRKAGHFVVASDELSGTDRALLLKAGYIKPVIRGWYLTSRPGERDGETTAWQANWPEFLARYCAKRFGGEWHLSPEQSLHRQTTTPLPARQLHIYASGGHNNAIPLIHGWSLLDQKVAALAPVAERQAHDGLRVLSIPYALTQVSESFFQLQSSAAQIALELLPDPSDIARILISIGKPVVGGRLVGALRAVGREQDAITLRKTLEAVGYRVTETNPFREPPPVISASLKRSPYVIRIHQMWEAMRENVIAAFGDPPGMPANPTAYLADIDARYVADAYNSLSIEGYSVSRALIERVRSGGWNPDAEEDRGSRDAMAAKGYSLAHDAVKKTISSILAGENPGTAIRTSLLDWNLALWTPSVQAGILRPEDLAGYRNAPVFIRNADHVPPPREAVRDCMPAFFGLLEREDHAAVRAVLGHYVFVFIHPYMDGNGRLGRFIMNAMFASGGYPWTIIPVASRDTYMDALNQASGKNNIIPFADFLNEQVMKQRNHESTFAE